MKYNRISWENIKELTAVLDMLHECNASFEEEFNRCDLYYIII